MVTKIKMVYSINRINERNMIRSNNTILGLFSFAFL